MAEEHIEIESVEDSVLAAIKEIDGIDTEGKIEEPEEEKATEPEEEVEASEEEEAKEETPPEGEEEEEPEEAVELKAPENWDKDRKDAFEGIETDAAKQSYMDAVKNLERGFQEKRETLSTTTKEHEAIVTLMQPLEPQLHAAGLDRLGGIRTLIGAQQLLQQNPLQGVTQLIQQYGGHNAKAIVQSLAQQYGVTEAAEGEAYVDKDILALRDQITGLSNTIQQNETNTQTQRATEAQEQVDTFEKATDSDGNVLHPHFDKVKISMGMLLQTGTTATMDEAYETAIRMDAGLHSELIKSKQEQEASKSNKERKKVVKDSKQASKNVKTNNVAPDSEPAEPDDVRQSVLKAAAAV